MSKVVNKVVGKKLLKYESIRKNGGEYFNLDFEGDEGRTIRLTITSSTSNLAMTTRILPEERLPDFARARRRSPRAGYSS